MLTDAKKNLINECLLAQTCQALRWCRSRPFPHILALQSCKDPSLSFLLTQDMAMIVPLFLGARSQTDLFTGFSQQATVRFLTSLKSRQFCHKYFLSAL